MKVSNLAILALLVEGFYLVKDDGNEINGFKGSKEFDFEGNACY
jgi:hypothetical protein